MIYNANKKKKSNQRFVKGVNSMFRNVFKFLQQIGASVTTQHKQRY